ncbi:hypothetical protein EIK77_000515 [Talaromyces pinophilus]|nr:hypothetical protein EIK77_000515 [Talaromyces pinophilus]
MPKVLAQNGGKYTSVLPYDVSAFPSNAVHGAANAETSNHEENYAKIAKSLAQNEGAELDTDFMPTDASIVPKIAEEAETADLAFVFSQFVWERLKGRLVLRPSI